MKRIQILGTGCPKCRQLTQNAEQAMLDAKIEGEIEKITDLSEIMKYGVMVTPALAVDGEVKSAGKVLSAGDICNLLRG